MKRIDGVTYELIVRGLLEDGTIQTASTYTGISRVTIRGWIKRHEALERLLCKNSRNKSNGARKRAKTREEKLNSYYKE